MIFILKYVFLGISLYILIIPILESLSALICQGIEVLKGKLIYQQALIQEQVDKINLEQQSSNNLTQAIGFAIPADEENYEEEIDEDP